MDLPFLEVGEAATCRESLHSATPRSRERGSGVNRNRKRWEGNCGFEHQNFIELPFLWHPTYSYCISIYILFTYLVHTSQLMSTDFKSATESTSTCCMALYGGDLLQLLLLLGAAQRRPIISDLWLLKRLSRNGNLRINDICKKRGPKMACGTGFKGVLTNSRCSRQQIFSDVYFKQYIKPLVTLVLGFADSLTQPLVFERFVVVSELDLIAILVLDSLIELRETSHTEASHQSWMLSFC